MPKYRIVLEQTVYQEATVIVEAYNLEEAERLAVEKGTEAHLSGVEWRFVETAGPIGIESAEEI
jgi:hypothetical protein